MISGLTNKENEVLEILLHSERSLTGAEIIAKNKGLNNNTVQSVLRSLLKSDLIEVADIVYSGKVLCRSYRASSKSKDLALQDFASHFQSLRRSASIPKIFAALIDSEKDELDIIETLKQMINRKKETMVKEEK